MNDKIIEKYIMYLKIEKNSSINTINSYKEDLVLFSSVIKKDLLKVTSDDIRNYLKKYNIEVDGIGCEKPPAIVYIDDRAICFNGDTTNLAEQVRNFKPWTKK